MESEPVVSFEQQGKNWMVSVVSRNNIYNRNYKEKMGKKMGRTSENLKALQGWKL